MKEVYASLDFGSSTLKLIVAEIINSNIHILYSKKTQSHGIKQGNIEDPEAVMKDIKELMDDAHDDLGSPIKKVLLNIPAIACQLYRQNGTAKILTDDKVVTANDVLKALKNASKVDKRKDEYVVTYIPIKYNYDKVETDKLPIGKKASTVVVDALIITSLKKIFYPYIKVVEDSGLEIMEVCINAYAGAKEVFDEASLIDGAILIDIGHETTTVSYFENGFLQSIAIEKSGSSAFSRLVSNKWRITPEKAESLKVKYGSCIVDPNDQDIVAVVGEKKDKKIYTKSDLAATLIEAVEELMGKIGQKLRKNCTIDGKQIYIVGGGGELLGIEAIASKVLQTEVQAYRPETIGARDMAYVNNLGLIYFLMDRTILFGKQANSVDMPSITNTVSLKVKGLTKMPTNEGMFKTLVDKLIVNEGEDDDDDEE